MFWGKGDSSKLSQTEQEALTVLRRLEETGHLVALTPDQTLVALAAIRFYSNVTAASGVLAGARNVAMWIGGCLVAYWAAKDVIVNFIKSSAGG